MGYEPLHHKYRPQTFADLVGQNAIATTLTHAIEAQRIAPAYLFTGPRGTGKTSSARILAKSLNCITSEKPTATPCGACSVCREIAQGNALDVIEIDAASNTGVDNIRELIERAQFAPVQCRFKIYCLDEVHMLSTAAFNALLKTLEEPPAQVVFVLATTDPQRVLATIISRCQRFDFRRIPLTAMVEHLTYISEQEAISITPAAVELVGQLSQGGLRDAESLLDQLSLLSEEITPEHIWELAGSVPERDLLTLLRAIMAGQPDVVISQIHQLLNRGRDPLIVLQNLTGFYRDILIAKTAPDRRDLVAITEATWGELCEVAQQIELSTILLGQQHLRTCEPQVKNTTQPRLWLEVALLGLLPDAIAPATVAVQPVAAPQPTLSVQAVPAPQVSLAQNTTAPATEAAQATQPQASSPPVSAPQTSAVSGETALPPTPPQEPAASTAISQPSATAQVQAPSSAAQQPTEQQQPAVESTASTDNLDQLWQQMLANLHPAGRALFNQHGHLLSFSGNQAKIGLPKGLIPTASRKVEEVEAAFQAVLNRTVKVNLAINTPTEQAQAAQAQAQTSQSSSPQRQTSPAQTPQFQATQAIAPPVSVPPQAQVSAPAQTTSTTMVANPPATAPSIATAPAISEDLPAKANLGPAPPMWQTEDELTQTSRSFANFFGGTLVEDAPDLE